MQVRLTHLWVNFWVICFVPNCLFHFIGAKLSISYHGAKLSVCLLCAKLWAFTIIVKNFPVPNCPRTIHTPQIVVNYRKFLLWTCETERKEVLCFEHFKLLESVLKRIKKHSKTKYIHCWKDWRRPRPNSLVNAACKQLLCIVHLSHVTHALSLHSYCCGK